MTTRGQIAGGVDSVNLAGSTGSNLVGFLQAGTGAVARTVQGKERDIVSVKDFGATGDGVTDDTAAIQAAATAAAGNKLIFPANSTYLFSTFNVSANTTIDITGATLKQAVLGNLVGSPMINVIGTGVSIIGGGTGLMDGQKSAQPANGFSDSFNAGANGTGRAFRAAIKADALVTSSILKLKVFGVNFQNTYGACVATLDVKTVWVKDCDSNNCNFELAYPYNSGAAQLLEFQATGNTINNCGSGDAAVNADGIVSVNYRRTLITDNVCYNIERCLCKIENGAHAEFSNNILDTNTKDNYAMFQLTATLGTNKTLIISNNNAFSVGKGIYITGPSSTIDVISITGNNVYTTTGTATGEGYAVDTTSKQLTISGNNGYNIKRHGIYIQGMHDVSNIAANNLTGQGSNITFGLTLNMTVGNWAKFKATGNTFYNFEASAVGSGTVNFSRSAAYVITNFTFQGNEIDSGANGNRAMRTAGVDLFAGGIISDNKILGQMELFSAGVMYRNNTITGTVTLPAGTANVEVNGTTQTTIGANGAATALTANPVGYTKITVNGTARIVPYYNP